MPTRSFSKWGLRITMTCAAMVIIVYIASCHVAPYSVIKPHRLSQVEIALLIPQPNPGQFGLVPDTLDIPVNDSLSLRGWFFHALSDSVQGTIMVLHGIASCKEAMLPVADKLCRNRFNVVLFDLRAHGESDGDYCTYGYYEKRDMVVVIDSILSKYPHSTPLAMYGNSLGSAIALQTMAIEPRISCAVVESPFATLREIVSDYLTRLIKIRWRSFSDAALDEAGVIANFSVDDVAPETSALSIQVPVLVVHGTLDRHVSIEYGRRVFRNLQSQSKELFEIPDGDHYNLTTVGGEAYGEKFLSFFQKFCRR